MFYLYQEHDDGKGCLEVFEDKGYADMTFDLLTQAPTSHNLLMIEGSVIRTHKKPVSEPRVHTPLVDVDDFTTALEPSEVGYLREQAGDFCPSCGAEIAGNSICACQDSNEEAIAEQQSDKAREDEAEKGFIREGYDDIPF